jgi:DNA-binding MarR family transcriptional regulator
MSKSQSDVPAPGEGKRGSDGHVGYLLRQAANAFRNRGEQALTGLGLTLPQFSVMTIIDAYPRCSNADLARAALLTPQTVNAIVANLQKAGFVERRPHEFHGRILQLALTGEGVAKLAEAKARIYALEETLVSGLVADERRLLLGWLAAVSSGA